MGKLGSHGWNLLKICPHGHKKKMKKSSGRSINFRGSWGTLMIVRVILNRKSQLLVFVKSENRFLEKKRKKKKIYLRFEMEHMSYNYHQYRKIIVKVKKRFLVELRAI